MPSAPEVLSAGELARRASRGPVILRGLAFLAVALLLARGGLLLARDPCLGVADNLDYWRVARPAGIVVEPQPRQGSYVVCSYPETEPDLASAFSSAALVAYAARHAGWGLGGARETFDLRQLGLLYLLLSAVLLFGALAAGLHGALAVAVAWVLVDPGFLLFFNSLYADPALVLGMIGTVCLLALPSAERATSRPLRLALLLVLAAVAGSSKMQYSPFPLVLLAAFLGALLFERRRPTRGEVAFLAALAVLSIAAPLHFLYGKGPRFPEANNYNATYGGIARVASSPAAALAALGIPEEHRSRPPQDYFAAESGPDDPVQPYLRHLSRLRLAGLYLADPGALQRTGAQIEEALWRVRTHPRGTFTHAESGRQAGSYRTPEQFSIWRARLLGWLPPGRTLLVIGLVLIALGRRAWRRTWTARETTWLFLLLWFGGQLAVAVLGEGFVNLHQHLLGSRLALDLLLALLGVAAAARIPRLAGVRPGTGVASASPRER